LGNVGESLYIESFFPIVDIMFRCRDMFSQSSNLVPKKRFAPSRYGVNAQGSSDQIFK